MYYENILTGIRYFYVFKKILLSQTKKKKNATLMNNCFVNVTNNLDLKPSAVPNTSDIDELSKHFDDHISV